MKQNDPFFMKLLPIEFKEKSKVVSVMNHKGGVGKTSLTEFFARWLVKQGNHVLVIDNDPQCNITQRFSILSDFEFVDRRIDEFYKELPRPTFDSKYLPIALLYKDTLKKNSGKLGLIAGSPESEIYAGTARNALGLRECIKRNNKQINQFRDFFDYILIDTAPAIHNNAANELSINAADHLLIPVDGSEAVMGLNQFMHWAQRILIDKKPGATFVLSKYQPDTIDIQKAHINLYTNRPESKNSMYRAMKYVLGDYVCDQGIQEKKTIKSHSYSGLQGIAKRDYINLCKELVKKIETNEDTLDYWIKIDAKNKLDKLIQPIQISRNKGMTFQYTNFHFAEEGEQA
jgi:chromosome partitioning protein